MGEASSTVVRQRRPPRLYTRNLLSDLDTMVERALAAAEDERRPEPLIDEAVEVANDLTFCGEAGHKHRPFEKGHFRRLLELAVSAFGDRAFDLGKAQLYAGVAKGYVRARACSTSVHSFSGRPVWR